MSNEPISIKKEFDILNREIITKVCSTHGEYKTYRVVVNGKEYIGKCPQCELEEEQDKKEACKKAYIAEKKIKVITDLKESLICCGADTSSVNVKSFNEDTLERKQAVNTLDRLLSGELFLVSIIGAQGRGKTVLATQTAKRYAREVESSKDILYVKESTIIRSVKSSYSYGSSELQYISELQNVKFLIIDEILESNADSKAATLLEDILLDRFAKNLKTIICGNVTANDLKEKFSARILSRLINCGAIITLNGTDRRRNDKEVKQLPAMKAIYQKITGNFNSSINFITPESIEADVSNASPQAIVKLLNATVEYLKRN